MNERHRRVRELFARALPLGDTQRRELLERECGDDEALREEIVDLLSRSPATSELRVAPPAHDDGPRHDDDIDGPLPERIGRYRIIRRLGAGGMGVVYEAEQEHPRRRVALKVIRGGSQDEIRVRLFRREIEALARLDHPDIATIHESGRAADGQLYFAMELVRGVPLDDHLARERSPGESSRARLESDLRLFRRICLAVHCAHQHAIVHRDLKPANIFVTPPASGSGTSEPMVAGVKVMDFGLARVLDEGDEASLVTQPGHVRGTLQYMSPEQVRGDRDGVDVRTDVYALGVVLYLLLTGKHPYDVQSLSLMEAMRVVCDTPPAPLRGRVDADLEVITVKALAKEADQRYQSALALADDVGRYLAALPILARPQSTMYQLRQLVRRHRAEAALATTLLVALIGFAVWMSVLYGRADANLSRALIAEQDATRRAETSERVSDFLKELFEASHPAVARGEELTARELLDAGSERIDRELASEPEIRAELQETMGITYLELGLLEPAERLLTSALATHIDVHGEEHVEVPSIMVKVGWVQIQQGHFAEAESTLNRALERAERSPGRHLQVAEGLDALGTLYWHQRRQAAADSALTLALMEFEQAFGPDDERVAQACNNLGNVKMARLQYAEAETLLRRAIDIRTRTLGDDHPSIGSSKNNLAEVYRRQGRDEEAETTYLESLAIKVETLGPEHPDLAYTHNNLGLLYKRMERYASAEEHLRKALDIRRKTLPSDHQLLAWTLDNLATVYVASDRLDEAAPLFEEALDIADHAVGREHVDYAILESNKAWLLEKQGEVSLARPLREHVLEVQEAAFGPDSPRLASGLRQLAENHVLAGDLESARSLYGRAVALLEAAHGPDADSVVEARAQLDALDREPANDALDR